MDKVTPRILSGFMELLPERQMQMERMMQVLREIFSLYGFAPLDTPAIELAEVLLAKGGGETEKQIYAFTKGDSELALRFDLTVPLARFVAQNYAQLSFPFRRYQIGKVYRGERAQRGRFREFYQADIDVIGDGTLDISSDAEIPAIIYRIFSTLGLRRFKIRVNNRKIPQGFCDMLGIADKAGVVMREIDKIDKQGVEKTRAELLKVTADEALTGELMRFITISGGVDDKISALERYAGRSELFDLGLSELKAVTSCLPEFGVPAENFDIDLSVVRGLDYYTGTVYETVMLDNLEVGSICSGGRYDNLAEYYTDRKLPGVGISIGLTRLFFVLEDQGYLNDNMLFSPADVIILPMTENLSVPTTAATALREAGLRVLVYSGNKKVSVKLKYAGKLKIPYALFIGEAEIAAGKVTLRNLDCGDQETLELAGAIEIISGAIAAKRAAPVIIDKE